MSGAGRPEEGTVDAAGLRLGVVCTRWNGQVVEQAVQRSGGPGSTEDKGYEATVAALDPALVLGGLRHRPGRPPP